MFAGNRPRSGNTLTESRPAASLAEGCVRSGRLLEHGEQGRTVAIGQFSRLDAAERALRGDFQHAVDEARHGHSPQGSGPSNLRLERLRLPKGGP
jgi:hypothetical protein